MTRPDRVQIEYQLTFTSPFHFGTGIKAGLIDRTVVRNAGGYLHQPSKAFFVSTASSSLASTSQNSR